LLLVSEKLLQSAAALVTCMCMPVCSLAVRDVAVKSALSTDLAVNAAAKLLSPLGIGTSDIDTIVCDLRSRYDQETSSELVTETGPD